MSELKSQLQTALTNIIESYLFFALSLRGDKYTRGDLVRITREINELTRMSSMILFSYNNNLTKGNSLTACLSPL